MKKWSVLVIIVLCGLLLSLKFLSRKNSAELSVPVAPAQEESGVALPAAATGYVAPETAPAAATVVPYVEGAGDYNGLMLPPLARAYAGACQGGSLEDMRSTHGRYWGYFAKNIPFSFEDTRKMYDYTASYVACSAVARGSVELCSSLPGEASAGGMKVDGKMSVSYQCKDKANPILFLAYLAGKNKSTADCYSALAGLNQKILSKVSVSDLCDAASRGMGPLKKYLMKAIPDRERKIRMMFPDSRSECDGSQDCLDSLAAYTAIKDANPSECPRGVRALCEAVILRSADPCAAVVRDMSSFYCATVEKVKKAHGGCIGMTSQDIQATMEKTKADKKLADQQKAENDKIQAETNRKIKKLLGGE
jgi:hypothetical protein